MLNTTQNDQNLAFAWHCRRIINSNGENNSSKEHAMEIFKKKLKLISLQGWVLSL
jgi:hypothetical protein